ERATRASPAGLQLPFHAQSTWHCRNALISGLTPAPRVRHCAPGAHQGVVPPTVAQGRTCIVNVASRTCLEVAVGVFEIDVADRGTGSDGGSLCPSAGESAGRTSSDGGRYGRCDTGRTRHGDARRDGDYTRANRGPARAQRRRSAPPRVVGGRARS